jgi:hypothetical protein
VKTCAFGLVQDSFAITNSCEATNLILQPWIGHRLNLIERFEVRCIGYVIEQGNWRKLGVDQALGL